MHLIQVTALLVMSAVWRPLLSATQDAMKQLRKQPACSVDAMSADRFAHDTEPATARWYFLMFPPSQLVVQFHVVSACGANYGPSLRPCLRHGFNSIPNYVTAASGLQVRVPLDGIYEVRVYSSQVLKHAFSLSRFHIKAEGFSYGRCNTTF